eukprot:scaffold13161_cov30-Cyclotella_meneghiniana.AAC.1
MPWPTDLAVVLLCLCCLPNSCCIYTRNFGNVFSDFFFASQSRRAGSNSPDASKVASAKASRNSCHVWALIRWGGCVLGWRGCWLRVCLLAFLHGGSMEEAEESGFLNESRRESFG